MAFGIGRYLSENPIGFMAYRRIGFVISVLLVAASIGLVMTRGLNLGIDFVGGIVMDVQTDGPADIPMMRSELEAAGLAGVTLQEFGAENNVMIRLPEQAGGNEGQQEAIETVRAVLDNIIGEGIEYRRVEFVGPQVGGELVQKGLIAFVSALAGIMLYIMFRFQLQFSMGAIAALLHDCIVTIGFFSLTQLEFNLSTIAAVLLIAGYSVNDTVVVYDRIRENLRKYRKKPVQEILDGSLNSTLSRTILTSITTMLALIALLAFGGPVIRDFVIAMMIGIAIGTYSSIFVATPTLLDLGLKNSE